MRISLRPVTRADLMACGHICYEAFSAIASEHNFPVDWRSEDVAVQVIAARLGQPLTYGIVAEADGKVVGSAFLKEHRPIGAIGPVTVALRFQGRKLGRLMMEQLIERGRALGLEGLRLVQAAYNAHSLALYTKLGFQVREMLACLHGKPVAQVMSDHTVGTASEQDAAACNALCLRLHGYARTDDVAEAVRSMELKVVEREGKICAYTTGVHFRGHTVAESNEDVKSLIAVVESLPEPGLLMPARNLDLLRWALDHGLQITQPLALMTRGFYQEPQGAFLPSIHA